MKTGFKFICLIVCAAVMVSCLPVFNAVAVAQCLELTGGNASANEYYYYYAMPMTSYLVPEVNGGYMRFQAGALSGAYVVEYYTADFKLVSQKTVAEELSIFGGFYTNGTNHFVLSGQTNFEESASVECFRVTKYDLNWNRLSSSGLYNCDTTVPFDAGCPRFAEMDGKLIVRTSHEMYTRADGLNHQANYTLLVDINSMAVTGTANLAYSSHSFNQFIKADGNSYVTVDHGDAYPRSIVLAVSQQNGSTFRKLLNVDLQSFIGSIGENYTGAALGGLEISQSAYLTAYSCVVQDGNYRSNTTKNVYLAVTDKTNGTTVIKQHTAFNEGEMGAGTPQLVKINANRFVLMWQIGSTVYYTVTDGAGNAIGKTKSIESAVLSDCQPVAVGGKVIWYWYKDSRITFCSIDAEGSAAAEKTEVNTGHDYKVYSYNAETPETCTQRCEKCGKIAEFTTGKSITMMWSENNRMFSSKSTRFDFEPGSGQPLYFYNYARNDPAKEVIMKVENGKTVTIVEGRNGYNTMYFPENGVYKLTFTYKYNPYISRTYRISVGDYIKLGDVNEDGVINNQDASMILRYDAGLIDSIEHGDVNYDGVVDNMDAVLVLRYDAGIINEIE